MRVEEFWQKVSHSTGDHKNVKTHRQCMSLTEKLNCIFFRFRVLLRTCDGDGLEAEVFAVEDDEARLRVDLLQLIRPLVEVLGHAARPHLLHLPQVNCEKIQQQSSDTGTRHLMQSSVPTFATRCSTDGTAILECGGGGWWPCLPIT